MLRPTNTLQPRVGYERVSIRLDGCALLGLECGYGGIGIGERALYNLLYIL
jgi:hypothetical protein